MEKESDEESDENDEIDTTDMTDLEGEEPTYYRRKRIKNFNTKPNA